MVAVQRNHPNVVKTLVESGVDINRFDFEGKTALAMAVELGFVDIAVYLMKEGKADTKTRTNQLIIKQGRKILFTQPGYTLMDLAKKSNRPDAMTQAILEEEERRKPSSGRALLADDETTQPAAKKQRVADKEGEEAEDLRNID